MVGVSKDERAVQLEASIKTTANVMKYVMKAHLALGSLSEITQEDFEQWQDAINYAI